MIRETRMLHPAQSIVYTLKQKYQPTPKNKLK